jgi:CRISPR-associated Csx14 family protein
MDINLPGKASATLIATLGSEAQVVTATLDLLEQQGERIESVCVAHTVNPDTPIAQAVARLEGAFASPPYAERLRLRLLPLVDGTGRPLQDVDTPRAAQAAFRLIYAEIRRAKQTGCRVHLSIAGGRKTLALFGMAAAQLLFDEGDRLWHLYSGGEFLASKRLHPQAGDEAHLIPIPVTLWSWVSPVMAALGEVDDPFEAVERVRALQLAERMEQARGFVLGALTPAERRVAALLVREGLSDQEIAARLVVSPRTVEQHLRAAYRKAEAHWEVSGVGRMQLAALLGMYLQMVDVAW